jgi:hypothetical protein
MTSSSRLIPTSFSWACTFCASLTEVAYSPCDTMVLTTTLVLPDLAR